MIGAGWAGLFLKSTTISPVYRMLRRSLVLVMAAPQKPLVDTIKLKKEAFHAWFALGFSDAAKVLGDQKYYSFSSH